MRSFCENELGSRCVSFRKADEESITNATRMNYHAENSLQFEVLEDARVDEQVEFNGEEVSLKKALGEVEVNQRRIFAGIEMGTEKNHHNLLTTMKKRYSAIAKE